MNLLNNHRVSTLCALLLRFCAWTAYSLSTVSQNIEIPCQLLQIAGLQEIYRY